MSELTRNEQFIIAVVIALVITYFFVQTYCLMKINTVTGCKDCEYEEVVNKKLQNLQSKPLSIVLEDLIQNRNAKRVELEIKSIDTHFVAELAYINQNNIDYALNKELYAQYMNDTVDSVIEVPGLEDDYTIVILAKEEEVENDKNNL